MKQSLLWLYLIALGLRIIVGVLAYNDYIFKSPSDGISIVFQRSAYLHSFGYGYSQTEPGSPAYKDLMNSIRNVENREPYKKEISNQGIYSTQHYPPGWSLVASVLFLLTGLPVSFLMMLVGIMISIIGLFYFRKICFIFLNERQTNIASWLYAAFPPLLYSSISLTPDLFMLISLIIISYFFLSNILKKGNAFWKATLIIGIVNGISGLFRSDFFLFPFFISLVLALLIIQTKEYDRIKRFFLFNTSVALMTFLILLPWGVRNKMLFNKFSLTSSALGGTLVTGLGAYANPWNLGPSDIDRKKEASLVGIKHPFEMEGDQFFRKNFINYVSQKPSYLAPILLRRTFFFILSPHLWGVKKLNKSKSFSEMRSNSSLIKNTGYIFRYYWMELTSILFSVFSFFALLYYSIKGQNRQFAVFCILSYLYVYLTHVPIHMISNYVFPLIFVQILLFSLLWDQLTIKIKSKLN